MKATWLSTCGGGCHGSFYSSKKLSADNKELNTIITSTMTKALKIKKNYKGKTKGNSESDAESENFNFENLYIGEESGS